MQQQQRAAGGRHGRRLQSLQNFISDIRLRQSINLKNNHAKFHPDPISNDGGFFEARRPNKKNNKMSSDMESVPDPVTSTPIAE